MTTLTAGLLRVWRTIVPADHRRLRGAALRPEVIGLEPLEGRKLLAATSFDLDIDARVANITKLQDYTNQYSADAIGASKGGVIDYLETHQFEIDVPANPQQATNVNVTVKQLNTKGFSTTNYPNFQVMWKGSFVKNTATNNTPKFTWGQSFTVPVSKNVPAHLTIVPYSTTGGLDKNAYAVWLSPKPEQQYNITKDLTWASQEKDFNDVGLIKPKWKFDANGNNGNGELRFVGSLDNYNKNGTSAGKPVSLTIAPNVSVDVPLTNGYTVVKLPQGLAANVITALKKLDGKSDLSVLRNDTNATNALNAISIANIVEHKKPELWGTVLINGLGRINGYTTHNNRDVPLMDFNKYQNNRMTLLTAIQCGQYMVRSGLVEVRSVTDIKVSGVSVAYGPQRHQEFIQLKSSGGEITLFDVKTPGAFIDAADGPGMLSKGTASWLYLHHDDDSIKVFASEQQFRNITLIQGNAGAAIDLGAYGYNSPISKATVSGVFVHRVKQFGGGYDGLNALITTRHGAWKYTDSDNYPKDIPHNIQNVTISAVTVFDLGKPFNSKDSTNVYLRKTAIGFYPGGGFKPKNSTPVPTEFSNITIDFISGLAPTDKTPTKEIKKGGSVYVKAASGQLLYNLGVGEKYGKGTAKGPFDVTRAQAATGTQYGTFTNVNDNSMKPPVVRVPRSA
jgi:hypothetical protein